MTKQEKKRANRDMIRQARANRREERRREADQVDMVDSDDQRAQLIATRIAYLTQKGRPMAQAAGIAISEQLAELTAEIEGAYQTEKDRVMAQLRAEWASVYAARAETEAPVADVLDMPDPDGDPAVMDDADHERNP